MDASDIKPLKELEAENTQLKIMFAELSVENMAIKDILEKSSNGRCEAITRYASTRHTLIECT